jgi:hypothetical protein
MSELSLAGPRVSPPQADMHNTYYDTYYKDHNPWMSEQKPQNAEFSLAGTFPHRARWYRPKQQERGADPKFEKSEDEGKGATEAAPQVQAAEDQQESLAEWATADTRLSQRQRRGR